jgi:hypothetical protein
MFMELLLLLLQLLKLLERRQLLLMDKNRMMLALQIQAEPWIRQSLKIQSAV